MIDFRLSQSEINNITHHKYKGGVLTPLDKILTPFWDSLANYCPN